MYKMMTTTIVLIVLAVTGGMAAAGPQDSDHNDRWERSRDNTAGPGMPGVIAGRMAERLGLDDVQRQSVMNVMDAARPEFEALREQGKTLRQSIRDLDPGEPSYGVRLQDLSATSGQVAADLVLLTGRVRADVHAILTPEQRQSFAEMTAQFDGRRGKGPRPQ